MRKPRIIVLLALLFAVLPFVAPAQEQLPLVVQALNKIISSAPEGHVDYDLANGTAHGTNVFVQYGNASLMADSADLNMQTGEVKADGHVRLQQGDEVWVGEHIRYNFKTRQMQSEDFRMGKAPGFAQGEQLQGDQSNQVYLARHAFVTTDDVSNPAIRVRSSHIKIVPGKYVEMWNAVMYVDGVPTFYFPYYWRELGPRANTFNFLPGYRSAYGPYLLSTYTWYLNDAVDGRFHLDYRELRGVGAGPDLNLHLGRWGEAVFKYYYTYDERPNTSTNGTTWTNGIPNDRQRVYFAYQATPATNLNVKALVNYQSDQFVLHDFFLSDFANNPQPNSFTEVNKYWNNWSVDTLTTPQVNDFFSQVERLPDVRLAGYRQQLFNSPVYYDSVNSAGYYRAYFVDTNAALATNYSAMRVDSFQQLLLPETLFGWLNLTPRVGGRYTYYGSETGPEGTNSAANRWVFNTGAETSFKLSRLWTGATNSLLAVDGLRHVIEPSVTYAYVPTPNKTPSQVPQFDTQLPSPELLPIQFPDYNDIDAIDSENVLSFGLRNTLQTKRAGQIDSLLDSNVRLDWRLKPNPGQNPLNDLYSDLSFRPRTWALLDSQLRYDINGDAMNMAFHQLILEPNEKWSWGIGHFYVRNGFLGNGADSISSTLFFRMNDNWGLRSMHLFNIYTSQLQEQMYTIYRDMRSWTGALSVRLMDNGSGPMDFTVAFTFSLKATPRSHLGEDTVSPYHLVGE